MSDVIAVLIWWVLVQVFGLVALPLAFRLFRRLPDRGYGVSKALGLLLVSYLFWLLGILGFLRNDSGSAILSLVVVAGAAALFYHARAGASQDSLSAWLRANWKLILLTEVVFALAFGSWAVYRANVSRVMTSGGEKFMELAFLNSLQRSETLPPPDPWLSGFAISYYYFGYLMMSILTRLSGVAPSVGFNMGGALLFALTATGVFSLVYNLVASNTRGQRANDDAPSQARREQRVAIAMAALGIVLVMFLGNLEGALEVAHWKGLGSEGFWEWLDIADLDEAPPTHQDNPAMANRYTRPGWWWWRASRVVFDYNLPDWPHRSDGEAERRENIDEFPFFSFLLGDMHPHVLALPFIMLALSASLALLFKGAVESWDRWELGLLALIFGALGFLNTWDLPIQWAIAITAYTWGRLTHSQDEVTHIRPHLRPILTLAIPLVAGSFLLYAPFYVGFQSQAGGPLAHVHSSTRLAQFGVMFGPLLFILLAFLAWGLVRARRRGRLTLHTGAWVGVSLLLLSTGMLLATALAIRLSPRVRALVAPGMTDEPTQIALRYLGMRLSVPWVTLLLLGMIGAAVALLASALRTASPDEPPLFGRTAHLALFLLIAGALMTLAPEYVYLKDVFGVRMNTVFKFYFQAWILWSVAAAGAIYTMLFSQEKLGGLPRTLFGGGLALVISLGLVYPLLSIPDRLKEFPEAPTLDGTAYFATERPADYAAVQWLNAHVEGSPVILEKPGGAYEYEGRISAQTGLPTVLGWAGHEHQWRGNTIEQDRRAAAIRELCATTDLQRTLTLLREYDITYVYVGSLEQSECPGGWQKLGRLMQVVYDRDGVTIYKR
jgi:YYY domain-containing protein